MCFATFVKPKLTLAVKNKKSLPSTNERLLVYFTGSFTLLVTDLRLQLNHAWKCLP